MRLLFRCSIIGWVLVGGCTGPGLEPPFGDDNSSPGAGPAAPSFNNGGVPQTPDMGAAGDGETPPPTAPTRPTPNGDGTDDPDGAPANAGGGDSGQPDGGSRDGGVADGGGADGDGGAGDTGG